MPYKDWEKRKEYSRNLMRKRRSLVPVAGEVKRVAVNVKPVFGEVIPVFGEFIPFAVVVELC